VFEPSYFEQSVEEAGSGVGESREESLIDGMKLWVSPVVNLAKVLNLGGPLSIAP
jgi:hypothetical protein